MIVYKISSNEEVQSTHLKNLILMSANCVNQSDCQDVFQLNYFGQLSNGKYGIENKNSISENCRNKVGTIT